MKGRPPARQGRRHWVLTWRTGVQRLAARAAQAFRTSFRSQGRALQTLTST